MQTNIDITPTPRILRTLGDIPFDSWQCFAELIDNSLDAFKESLNLGIEIENPRVDIYWSNDSTPNSEKEIIVLDNGPGMSIETLQKAAKAGYSSNDPIHNLGLFGMGFNIATARLGDETIFISATPDSKEWIGIKIDFEDLIKNQSFSASIVREPKAHPKEHGVKIIIRKLKEGVYSDLKRKTIIIKRRLENVYTPILERKSVEICLQGKQLSAQPHCIWSDSRYVIRKGQKVSAIQRIEYDLGEAYFDIQRNRYLTEDEGDMLDINLRNTKQLPEHINKRARRLKGWIGIQRYSDPSDFGIDFIRNGRKILVADKSIFAVENPETGTLIQEYPVELGSTVGGRIVGELHVDYLIPTYQKNAFDTTDKTWRITLEAIRGAGPILPKRRATLGYDGENDSPLGKLINAFRRADPGTKNLAIPNSLAKNYAKEFKNGNTEFLNDDKWYKTAQEADRERGEGGKTSTPVNIGDIPSDDIDLYGPTEEDNFSKPVTNTSYEKNEPPQITSELNQLISNSVLIEGLSGKYAYGTTPGMSVKTWRTKDQSIRIAGERVPSITFQDGVDIDFFFDPQHPVLDEYPITPKQLLLLSLAEKFAIRDHKVPLQQAYVGLIQNHLNDERINSQSLYERSIAILDTIKDKLPNLLGHRIKKAMEIIAAIPSEEEELAKKLLDEAPQILQAYQNRTDEALNSLAFVTDKTIIRLIEAMPEDFLDGKLFDLPYSTINFADEDTNMRLRKVSIEKISSYLRDASSLLQGIKKLNKHELIRYSHTLSILESRIA